MAVSPPDCGLQRGRRIGRSGPSLSLRRDRVRGREEDQHVLGQDGMHFIDGATQEFDSKRTGCGYVSGLLDKPSAQNKLECNGYSVIEAEVDCRTDLHVIVRVGIAVNDLGRGQLSFQPLQHLPRGETQ